MAAIKKTIVSFMEFFLPASLAAFNISDVPSCEFAPHSFARAGLFCVHWSISIRCRPGSLAVYSAALDLCVTLTGDASGFFQLSDMA
jgi:hypothetical protein